jgi:hypothetical protein
MTATTGTTRPARPPRARAAAPGVEAIDAAIDLACRTLQLPTIRERYDEIAGTALREQASYKHFLADLLGAEVAERTQRRKLRLVRDAGFARPKRLEEFDYTANPAVAAEVIGTLTDPAWVRDGQPLVLLGDSGTGKSHLLIGIGTAIAEAGLKVRYTTCANLVNELVEAADEHHLTKTITRYGKVDLLCLDLCRTGNYADPAPGGGSRSLRWWAPRAGDLSGARHSYRPSRNASSGSAGR